MKLLIVLSMILLSTVVNAQVIKTYDLDSILEESTAGALHGEQWLSSVGPLSKYKGVLGPWGPLGSLGPIGRNFWNVTPVFSSIGDWTPLQKYLTHLGGPLSTRGPLFIMSELGQSIFNSLPHADLLSCGGILAVLGNTGPLGPLGVLGPLGPNGAHGYSINSDGEFVDQNNKIVSKIDVTGKNYPLYEFYHQNILDRVQLFDSSFSIEGELSSYGKIKLKIKSPEKQWINILIQNQYELDSFHLSVSDEQGNIIAKSKNEFLVNYVHLKVKKDTVLEVEVKHAGSMHFLLEKPFRLFVTGSGEGVEEDLNPNASYFR